MKSPNINNILHWFDGILWENPVLALGLGVSFAVICTTSLKNAAVVSLAMLLTAIPVYLLASLVAKYIPQALRIVAYILMASVMLFPARILAYRINPALDDSLGIYFALMALNPALLMPALSRRVIEDKPWLSALRGLCYSLGFALVLFGIALVREPLGSGTFWGHPVNLPVRLSPIQYSFGGFFLLGYLAALYQLLERVFRYLRVWSNNHKEKKNLQTVSSREYPEAKVDEGEVSPRKTKGKKHKKSEPSSGSASAGKI